MTRNSNRMNSTDYRSFSETKIGRNNKRDKFNQTAVTFAKINIKKSPEKSENPYASSKNSDLEDSLPEIFDGRQSR